MPTMLSTTDLGSLSAWQGGSTTKTVSVVTDNPMENGIKTGAGDVPQYGSRRPAPFRTVADEANFSGLGSLGVWSDALKNPIVAVAVVGAALLAWHALKRK